MDKKNLESSHMKAKARLAKYRAKRPVDESDEFKKEFVKMLAQDPDTFAQVMKDSPEQMRRLMMRYGGDNGISK